jgi:hypothetical protein
MQRSPLVHPGGALPNSGASNVRHTLKIAAAGVVLACALSTTAATAAPVPAPTTKPVDVSASDLVVQARYYGRGRVYGYRSYGYRSRVFGFALAAPVYNCWYSYRLGRRVCAY